MACRFPANLLQQYKSVTIRFKKSQKTLFKRANFADICDDLAVLGVKFDQADLHEYAALCWLAASKCEHDMGNRLSEVDLLIKSAAAFVKADAKMGQHHPNTNCHEHLAGAERCFSEALAVLDDDSVTKAAICRQLELLNCWTETASNFHSPSHRIYDLEREACENIASGHFTSALEKLTEISDNVYERKREDMYKKLLERVDLMILMLLLLLDLPPARRSPIHIRILQKFSPSNDNLVHLDSMLFSPQLLLAIQGLVYACDEQDSVDEARREFVSYFEDSLPQEYDIILRQLEDKFK